jgi:epoxyqueuosine reductase
MTALVHLKALILQRASGLGFVCVGIARARPSPRRQRFGRFLQRGCHAEMGWLARDPPSRCDPRTLLQGARSVICLAASYAPAPADEATAHVARYARGRDYHRLLRGRCRRLVEALSKAAPGVRTRICVDTSPLLERDLAAEAGLGWIGRNGCLLNRQFGSYLLLAEIITDLPLPPDSPAENRCGRCRACLRACPTGAIGEDGLVDSRRCISYLSIEHRGGIQQEFRGGWGTWVFGCDVCQQVCPFNRRLSAGDAELRGPAPLARTPLGAILGWTAEDWDRLTRGSAARRARLDMFLRNAAIAAGNAADPANRPALEGLTRHESPHVAEAAQWALRQLA